SARTIRRRLQQSGSVRKTSIAWSTLDAEPRRLRAANGAMKEGFGRQNGMKLSLLTGHASVATP
ncbi:hypothetical protein TNCV_2176271, partial [Trichonephila clavipes]